MGLLVVVGVIVIVVRGAEPAADDANEAVAARDLRRVLLGELPVSQAAKLAARITGRGRNEMYELALEIAKTRE